MSAQCGVKDLNGFIQQGGQANNASDHWTICLLHSSLMKEPSDSDKVPYNIK